MSEKNVYIQDKRSSKFIFWIFFGILAFIAIYFPFFQPNLRYQTGAALGSVMDILGNIFFTLGTLCMIFGGLGLIISRGGGGSIKSLVLGFLMLNIGQWLLGPGTVPLSSNSENIPIGYHCIQLFTSLFF